MSKFLGGYTHKVDPKGRFNLPAALVDEIAVSAEGTFVVVPGLDNCLDMYPLDEWIKRARLLRRIPQGMARIYKRKVLSKALYCKIDQQGRILIPPDFLRMVGIKREVFILGQLDHIELWNPDTFDKFIEENDVPLEDIYEDIEGYILKSDQEGRS